VVSDRGGVLVIDDPLSLLSAIIWLAVLGTWPVGFLFGACSACCDQDQCPWLLNFDRCLYFDNVNTSPQTGGTVPVSLRKSGGTGEVQSMVPVGFPVDNLSIFNLQSHIRITAQVSISASGASRTPVGDTRTQVWRFNLATPTNPGHFADNDFGPPWHLQVDLSVTGVATQEEAGVVSSLETDEYGQPKLVLNVSQWTATITRDEVVELFPVGLQRWGPAGTQSFRLSGLSATATRVSGDNYSGWTVSKLTGITILSRALAVRMSGKILLDENSVIDFLNGNSTLTGIATPIREYRILPNNALCGSTDTGLAIRLGALPPTITVTYPQSVRDADPYWCEESVAVSPADCSGYAGRWDHIRSQTVSQTTVVDIIWSIANGGQGSSDSPTFGRYNGRQRSLEQDFFGTFRRGLCPTGTTHCYRIFCMPSTVEVTIESLGYTTNAGLSCPGGAPGSTLASLEVLYLQTGPGDGVPLGVFPADNDCEHLLFRVVIAGNIEDWCEDSGEMQFTGSLTDALLFCPEATPPTTTLLPDDFFPATAPPASWTVSSYDEVPTVNLIQDPPDETCVLDNVSIDGITASGGTSIAAAQAGDCLYARLRFSTPAPCSTLSHSECDSCTPEVTIVSGSEYARVTYLASGEKADLIEIVALSTWLGGQGVTFTVTCNGSITHTLRRAFTVPTPPQNLTVVREPCSESFLEWQAPAWNGGQPITAYSVQFRRIGVTAWTTFATVSPTTFSATITGLVRVGYEFRVLAVSSVGTSAQSNIAVDGFALGAPTGLAFTRDPCNQAQLSWVAPTQSECVVVVNYRLEYRVGISGTFLVFGTVAGTETTGTITGLDPTLRYQFRVARIAEAGPDSFSGTVTSGTVPATPTSVVGSLTQNAGEVNLVWDAVEQQCFPNTDYNVQFRPDTTTTWSDFARPASTDKFATVTGLTAGVTYFFRVRAVNSIGNSAFSVQSQPVSIPFAE
jgi:hypothetical protein